MISFEKLMVTKVRRPAVVHFPKGRVYQAQNRSHFGLSFCLQGQVTYKMGSKTYVSRPNTAFLLPQGGSYSVLGEKEGLFFVVNFSCEGLDCKEITELPLKDPQGCIRRLETLQQFFLSNENQMKIYSVFYDLLDRLQSPSGASADRLTLLSKYIEEHLKDPALSNRELADYANISEVYLRKQFLSRYQRSPKQYILDLRIRKAKQLLVDTPFTVAAIAEECGFSGVYHFCRAFKQRVGKTPTQYAAENKPYQI